ncbi:MAG TPA: Rieske (2Fe-2S) protein [Candidatus Sulfopaludibacter sp.]|nr:Rieske (2Fe-2S) protein [Candidatus Sulfopaludibacter sp.]
MLLDRRQFLFLSAGLVAGCSSTSSDTFPSGRKVRVINAGPASDYAAEGVYDRFRPLGFFIIRRGTRLFALSSICTHRRCLVGVESGRSFLCPCHGSTFDPDGRVTHGPAKRDLPALTTFTNESGDLLVTVPAI